MQKRQGYQPMFGALSGPDSPEIHYFPAVTDGELDPTKPQIVIYEPTAEVSLTGADYSFLPTRGTGTAPGNPPS